MEALKVHNHLIGDRQRLDEAWEKDGYWYFKNVLCTAAVGRLRGTFVTELEKLGVIDPVGASPTDKGVIYNGASLSQFPERMDPLSEKHAWKSFTAEPAIQTFFENLLGDNPIWVPIVEYRATPPTPGVIKNPTDRFTGVHQDGPYSPGIPFRICWIPLATIDEDIGGLALVEGMTEKINLHPLVNGSNTYIAPSTFALDRWRRATYEAGDVLLVNMWTPHSGLTNVSSYFRLSLDHRVMTARDGSIIIGTVKSISLTSISVQDEEGVTRILRIDPDTYARPTVGKRLYGDEMLGYFKSGTAVILAHEDGKATVVRPPHG